MSVLLTTIMAAAHAATVTGTVRAQDNGAPIGNAEIIVDGQLIASSDARGRFEVVIPDGQSSVSIRVLSVDHRPGEVVVSLPANGPIVIALAPGAPAHEVVIEAARTSPHAVRQILDRERVEDTPGTYGDPIRLIQSLPGSVATREYGPAAGEVILRGSGPGESLVYLDGVEIPYLYHFQQYASVIHTRLLDEVAVYPSAFGTAYGNATGGVVAVETRDALAEDVQGDINLNLVIAGGYVTAPAGQGGGVSVSGRRSYADLLESESDQYTVWPVFWDYLGRYDRALSPDHHITLTGLGAGDSYGRYAGDAAVLDPLEQESNPDFNFRRRFYGVMLVDDLVVSQGRLKTTLAFIDDEIAGTLPDASFVRREPYGWLRHQSLLFVGDRLQLDAGLEARFSRISREVDTDRAWLDVAQEAPLLARGVSLQEQAIRLVGGAWLEPRLQFGDTQVQPGVRMLVDSATTQTVADPRLTVQSVQSWGQLRAAVGQYSQAPDADALSALAGDPNLPIARSVHGALGVDSTIADRIEWSVDGWGKQLQDVVVWDPGEQPTVEDGWALGVEVTSRYRIREVFFSWLSLSVGRARRGDAVFSYDQPIAANAVFSWNFRPQWDVGVRYRYASGLPYTPIAGSIYEGNDDSYRAVPGDINSARLPDYQKIDVHLGWERELRSVTLVLYAEGWYVLPGSNALYPVYNFDYSEQALVIGPSFVPLVGGRLAF